MNAVDYNCFVGGWPFHKVRNSHFKDLVMLHRQNGISYGYVSSTNAIFYNDPYEAELELHEEIKGSNYKHVMTVNPTLPGMVDDIHRAVNDFDIAGVRILPGFHNYSLDSDKIKQLCEILKTYKLPLFLTLRMEDERCTYMFHPKTVPIEEIIQFISEEKDLNILLCNIRMDELEQMKEVLPQNPNVAFDSSGLKDGLFPVENLIRYGIADQLVYGSLAPVFCLKSTLLLIEADQVAPEMQKQILSGKNFRRNA